VAGADAGAGFGAGMVGVTTARPTAGAAVRFYLIRFDH
jgi:hypothetical protein